MVVHVDVMDGVFCPQFTVGPPIVKAIPESFIKDCHLMIDEPLDKVQAYVDAGAGIITFHRGVDEAPAPRPPVPRRFRRRPRHRLEPRYAGAKSVEPLIDDLELVLLLAINPGWSGQKFIPGTARRVAAARELIAGREVVLGVDGGVTKANIDRRRRSSPGPGG